MSQKSIEKAGQTTPQLTPREAVRKRPGMYFGGTDADALRQLVWEVVNNAVDEALKGHCTQIDVRLYDDCAVSIQDNGAGIPIEPDPDTGRSILEIILTEMRGNQSDPTENLFRSTMRSVGLRVVNAVSSELTMHVKRNGFLWQQRYAEGERRSELEQVRPLSSEEHTGTEITLKPDFSIFSPNDFDFDVLSRRFRELAFLVPGLTINLEDNRSSMEHQAIRLSYKGGLRDYVKHLNRDYPVLHDPIGIKKTVELERDYKPLGYPAIIEIGMQYTNVHQPIVLSFVNAFEIEGGGPHVQGLIEGLTRAIGDYAKLTGLVKGNGYYAFENDDILCGLTAVLSIWHPAPEFEGCARYRLANPELEDAVFDLVWNALEKYGERSPDSMRGIVEHCLENKATRWQRRYGK